MKRSNVQTLGIALVFVTSTTGVVAGEPTWSAEEVFARVPHKWVLVTEQGGKRVIQTYCDAGTKTLTLKKENGRVELIRFFGQDSDLYPVTGGQVHANSVAVNVGQTETKAVVFTFVDKDRTLANVRIGSETALYAQSEDRGGRLDVSYTDTILGIPITPPAEQCLDP